MPERDGPESEKEIEITPAMIEAGVDTIGPFDLDDAREGWLSQAEMVRAIFLAMYREWLKSGPRPIGAEIRRANGAAKCSQHRQMRAFGSES